MQPLPDYIKDKFFKFLNGEENISDFEQWVYETHALEKAVGSSDYLPLISLNFSKRDSKYDVDEILRRCISCSEYEKWQLKNLLLAFKDKTGNPQQLLSKFYELYCDGYHFLDSLGLRCGFSARVLPNQYSSESWEELSSKEQSKLIDSLVPGAMREAQKVLTWLEEEKIVITNEQDKLGHYLFIDKRTEEEKQPIGSKVLGFSNSQKIKSWWRFWK